MGRIGRGRAEMGCSAHVVLLCILLSSRVPSAAQIPIAQARDLPPGTVVTVRGIVLNGGELGSIRYVQDSTAGIAVFPGSSSAPGFTPARGTDITVTGALKLFNGLLEIDPVTSFTVHATSVSLPAPRTIAPTGMNERRESRLVRINGCAISGGGGTFTNGTRTFTCAGESGVVFLRSGHPLIGSTIPAGAVDLIGIVSRYSTATPPVGGYQLLLRDAQDIRPATGIAILGTVEQDSITPEGFTLRWTTNLPGSSEVRHGPDATFGNLVSAPGSGTSHSVRVTGLGPASFHHAQVFSVSGSDTAWAPPAIHSTASALPGTITVYFTKSVDHSVASGPLAVDLGNAMPDTVIAHIAGARETLDIAVYNTNRAGIVTAANDARARGVRVRWITEGSQANSALRDLDPAIPVLRRRNASGSGMHNKFIIVDAASAPDATVLTGSANMTTAGLVSDANNLVIVRDQALAKAYQLEFEEMWGGGGALPDSLNARFGGAKTDNTPHRFNIGGTTVWSWFSPSDGTSDRIEASLRKARGSIAFALFSFTSTTLEEALVDMRAGAGVAVRGILEEDGIDPWIWSGLLAGGVEVRPDGARYQLHHKYAIVDRADPEAAVVITGSHNWSFNAENRNDENTLIIESADVAGQFHQEWTARWTAAVGVDGPGTPGAAITAHPNPMSGFLWITVSDDRAGQATARIVDTMGRTHLTARLEGRRTRLDVRGLASGTYVLVVDGAGHHARLLLVRDP